MAKNKRPKSEKTKNSNTYPVDKTVVNAHQQADKDIEQDPDLNSKAKPEDEMDEGELARLEGED